MAINSVGYDGTVTESQWADMIKKVGCADYGVVGANHLKVTTVTGADRTVSISSGKCWGHGVFDEMTSNSTIQLDSVGSGARWDLIAVRRNWAGTDGTTTLVKVNGSSSRAIPSGRNKGPGELDDQPIALVRITAGQTQPTAIVDLRCWAGNGGVTANDDLALYYLDTIGTQVVIDGRTWARSVDSGGSSEWNSSAGIGGIPLFGVGKSLAGGIPDKKSNFLVQTGTYVAKSDGAGNARIIWPKPFPNGVLYVAGSNGDNWSVPGMYVVSSGNAWGSEGFGNTKSWVYQLRDGDSAVTNKQHRINWIAIGW